MSSQGRRLAAQKEAKKQKPMTTVKPWPMFKRGTWFTVSHGVPRLQSPLRLLWFFIHPRPPLYHPQIQLMEAPLSKSTQATTSKGVMLGVNVEWLKTKQNWEIEKSPRGRETFSAAPWRGRKKRKATMCHELKKEGNKGRISIAYLSICLLSTKKSVSWVTFDLITTINTWEDNKSLFPRPQWPFFCVGSWKPIRTQWKALHWCSWLLPHSVIAELEAWWIVVSCFQTQCLALISLDALEA